MLYRSIYEGLNQYRRVIRYDGRGTGLSDREVEDMSFTGRAKDIEAVVDHLNLEAFDLFAWSQGGPAAIAYAAGHPDKVTRLILYGTFAHPFGVGREALCKALIALIRAEWSVGSKAIGEFVYPNAEHQHEAAISLYFRQASSAEVAAEILAEGMFNADVSHLLTKLSMPTLVLHRRDDSAVRFECGRQLASLIPNARLVPLPGNIHLPWHGDSESIFRTVAEFLDGEQRPTTVEAPHTHGLVTILFSDMEGSTMLIQRVGDASAQEVLHTHNAIVRRAVQDHDGAIVKTAGDGFMVSFTSASKAVECAMAIQQTLAQHNQEHPEIPIRVRIGLNAGEPIAEEQDLFGTVVIVASRIADDEITLIDDLSFAEPKTRDMAAVLKALGIQGQRLLVTVAGYDLAAFGGRFERDWMGGGSFAGQWGGAGLRGEATYRWRDPARPEHNAFRLTAGADYAFANTLYLVGEYFYNQGQPAAGPGPGFDPASLFLFTSEIFTRQRHFLSAGATYDITPLFRIEGYIIADLAGPSALWMPQMRYNLTANTDLTLGAQLFTSRPGGEFEPLSNLIFAQLWLHF